MDIVFEIMNRLSDFLRSYSNQLAVGFVATILVIFGTNVVHMVKEPIKKMHFLFRLTILILMSAIGFSFLTNVSNRLVSDFLDTLPDRWFGVVVISAFIGLGTIAEKKKFM